MNRVLFTIAALAALLASACDEPKAPAQQPEPQKEEPAEKAPGAAGVEVDKAALAAFAPLPDHYGEKAKDEVWQLGRMLYFDKRLSKNHDISCNSCHDVTKYGVDGLPTSTGHKEQKGGRNAPTVYNAAGHTAQFWDGRAADVEEQALGPVLNPVEMAMPDEKAALKVLASMPGYVEAFEKAFGKDGMSWQNVGVAIGAFERRLVTPAPFDKLLQGDASALTDEQKRGLNTFIATGCTSCHNGALLGGNTYQKIGAVKPWPRPDDQGRFEVTKKEADKHLFKVPSLRNVAKTAPYFHDGKTADLGEAVTLMARHQLGKELGPDEVASIVAFLGSLTGELPTELIAQPELPPSTDKTPKPDPS